MPAAALAMKNHQRWTSSAGERRVASSRLRSDGFGDARCVAHDLRWRRDRLVLGPIRACPSPPVRAPTTSLLIPAASLSTGVNGVSACAVRPSNDSQPPRLDVGTHPFAWRCRRRCRWWADAWRRRSSPPSQPSDAQDQPDWFAGFGKPGQRWYTINTSIARR